MKTISMNATVNFYEGEEIQGAQPGQYFGIVIFPDGTRFQLMWDVEEAKEIRRIMESDEAQAFVQEFMQHAWEQRFGAAVQVGEVTAVPNVDPKGNA